MLTFGSLFAGIGGFDRGFDRAGLTCEWQVELDDACNRVLQRHWPEATRYDDVRTVGAANLEPVDLICGGFPCQDVSVAGQRRGLAGKRSGLWFEFHRILAECRPRWVVIENVPGLLSSNGGSDFATILRGLVELGYGAAWRILDLQHFGVPQRRRRIFIVGHLGDGRAAQVLFEREGGGWHPTPSREAGPRVAGTLTGGSDGTGSHGKPNGSDRRELVVVATITSGIGVTGNAPGRRQEDDVNLVCAALRGNSHCDHDGDESKLIAFNWQSGGECRLGIKEEHTDALHAGQVPAIAFQCQGSNVGKMGTLRKGNGSTTGGVPFVLNDQGGERMDISEDITNTLRRDTKGHAPAVAVSINQRREGRLRDVHGSLNGHCSATQFDGVIERMAVRRLTPRECERLQSFPDDHTAGESDSARYRMLGNSVPPIVAEWLGRRILAACEARDD